MRSEGARAWSPAEGERRKEVSPLPDSRRSSPFGSTFLSTDYTSNISLAYHYKYGLREKESRMENFRTVPKTCRRLLYLVLYCSKIIGPW